MRLKNKFIALLVFIIIATTSCKKEVQNPTLQDKDFKVFFYGVGNDVKGTAWEGYNVLIGENVEIKLQISPKEGTSVSWQLEDGTVLNNTTDYTFTAAKEGLQRTLFIATRASGFADTTVFNFRGVLNGETSSLKKWKSVLIKKGRQTGTFTAAFDAVPSKKIIDGVIGFSNDIATTYSDLACIVRFNGNGKIDAHNGATYVSDNDIPYAAGTTYHFRMEIDASKMTYKAYVTPQGGTEIVINENLKFRDQTNNLKYWAVKAGDYNIDSPGTHHVSNMAITTHTLNEAPTFAPIIKQKVKEGQELDIPISVSDPLGGSIRLTVPNKLPRFATFTDLGGGKGLLKLAPYDKCKSCDLGEYSISIIAANKKTTTTQVINITVTGDLEIKADVADGSILGAKANNKINKVYVNLFMGAIGELGGTPGDDICAVIPFKLPVVPANKTIESAKLKIYVAVNSPFSPVSYDVYALPARAPSTILATDFFVGATDPTASVSIIQTGFIRKGTPPNPKGEPVGISINNAAASKLATFINQQYANGAKAGQFVFLRINADKKNLTPWLHAQFKSANTDIKGTEPVLIVRFKNK